MIHICDNSPIAAKHRSEGLNPHPHRSCRLARLGKHSASADGSAQQKAVVVYLRRTLPDGDKGSAPGEASQSPHPGAQIRRLRHSGMPRQTKPAESIGDRPQRRPKPKRLAVQARAARKMIAEILKCKHNGMAHPRAARTPRALGGPSRKSAARKKDCCLGSMRIAYRTPPLASPRQIPLFFLMVLRAGDSWPCTLSRR